MTIARRSYAVAQQAASTNSITVNKPAGTASGDLLIAFISYNNYAPKTPSGWTKIVQSNERTADGSNWGQTAFAKIAGGAEPANYTWTYDATWLGGGIGFIIAYTGAYPTLPTAVDGKGTATGGSGVQINRPVVPMSQDDDLVVASMTCADLGTLTFAHVSSVGGGTWSNQVESYGAYAGFGQNVSVSHRIGEKTYSSASANQSGAGSVNQPVYSKTAIALAIRNANRTPLAPSNLDPPDGHNVNLNAGYTFSWQFNDPDSDDSISAVAIKRNTGGSDQWYDVGAGTWGGSVVWNTVTDNKLTFPSGKWTASTTYNYAIAVKDQAGQASPYTAYQTVTSLTPPSLTWLAPNVYGAGTSPTLRWLSGNTQRGFHVKVFDADVAAAADFNVRTSPALWDSGYQTTDSPGTGSEAGSKQVQLPDGILEVGGTYTAYLQVHDTSDAYTNWFSQDISIDPDDPPAPSLVATAETTPSPRAKLDLSGHCNLLMANQADIEEGRTTGWLTLSNCTLTADGTGLIDKTWSILMTPSGAGDASMISLGSATSATKEGFPVTAGVAYKAMGTVALQSGSSRTCRLDIRWYDSTGAVISTTTGSTGTSGQITTTATAPTGATFAALIAIVLSTSGSGNVFAWDKFAMIPGTVTTWSRGGLINNNLMNLAASTAEPWSGLVGELNADVDAIVSSNALNGQQVHRITQTHASDVTMLVVPKVSQEDDTPALGILAEPCVPGTVMTFMAYLRKDAGNAGATTAKVMGRFWDADETELASISGNVVTLSSASWGLSVISWFVPANAATMQIAIFADTAFTGDIVYADNLSFHTGLSQLWCWPTRTRGSFLVEWSDDNVEWHDVYHSNQLLLNAAQQGTIYDYTLPLNPAVPRKYRARVQADV